MAELSRGDNVERLDLPPFDMLETSELLETLHGQSLREDVARRIHQQAQGNPFLASELLSVTGADTGTELPTRLRDILLARTIGLSEQADALLKVCAVIPGRIDHTVMASAATQWSRLSPDMIQEGVQEAVEAGLLVPEGEGYRFRHDLVARAVYDNLLPFAHALVGDLPANAPVVAAIEGLAASMRIPLSEAPEDQGAEAPDLGLTPREREVLLLVCDGLTNKEIGGQLFISPKTASVHVSNIMKKLKVERRAEAATVALRLGLAGPGGVPSTPTHQVCDVCTAAWPCLRGECGVHR